MKNKNVIVFDIDGTLTDSVSVHQFAFRSALQNFKFPALRTDWSSYRHHSDSAILTEAWEEANLGGKADMLRLEREYARFYDEAVRKTPFSEIRGARRFIDYMRKQGWIVVFATGSLRYGALHKLSVIGLDGESEILVTASEFETREEIVGRAVELGSAANGGQKPHRVISIGDGVWDLTTARNLGYEFFGIDSRRRKLLENFGVVMYRDFDDLYENERSSFEILK